MRCLWAIQLYVCCLQTDQGIRNLSPAKATNISGTDPDYAIRDLYNAIARGDFPTWSFYIQVMTFEEAEHFRWNPFDLTKVFNYLILFHKLRFSGLFHNTVSISHYMV